MSTQLQVMTVVELTPSELYWANVSVITRQLRRTILIYGLLGGFFAFTVALSRWHPAPNAEWQQMLGNATPLFLLFAALPILLLVAPALNARKYLADPRNVEELAINFPKRV